MNPSTIPAHRPKAAQRHWWMLATCLVAITALFFQSPRPYPDPGIVLLGAGIAISYFVRWRFSGPVFPWILRGVLWMLLILTGPEQKISGRFWYLDPAAMSMLGMCLEAELLVQHFLRPGELRSGILLLVSGGVMATASTTYEPRYIAFLAPAYVLCAFAAIRVFKPVTADSPTGASAKPPRIGRRWMLHGTALVLAVVMGFVSIGLLQTYRNQLMHFGSNWMLNLALRSSAGLNQNERLGGGFNAMEATTRTLKITGTARVMHLRGFAFDTYKDGGWSPNLGGRTLPKSTSNLANGPKFRVDRLDDSNGIVYLPLNTQGFALSEATPEIETGHRAVVLGVNEKSDVLTYWVDLPRDEVTQGPLCRRLTEEERARCLAVPEELAAAVAGVAREVKGENPQRTIQKTINYLRENHSYTLNTRLPKDDPVQAFLLNPGMKAHCQYFAASAAILLRLNGIPCRYVTGYFAHEATSRTSMVVRQRDAHAWVEAWVDPVGWVTVEATPASGTPEELAQKDPISWLQKLKERFGDWFSAVGEFFRMLKWQHIAMAGGVVMAIALLVQGVQTLRARKKRPRMRSYSFPAEKYRELAQQFEGMLRRLGDAPPSSATWSEHLRDQATQVSRLRPGRQAKLESAARFVDAYNRIRFGRPDDPAALQELEQLFCEMKEVR